MTAIGLAILIVAGVVTVDVVLENTRNTDASVAGQTIANVDLGGFFTAGVLVGIALMLGLMLLLAGLRRGRRQRHERKELTRSYEGTAAQAENLQDERDRLAAELESERRARSAEQLHGESGQNEPVHDGPAATTAGAAGGAPIDHRTRPVGEAPIYPGDPAGSGATAAGPTTATEDRATEDRATHDRATHDLKPQEHPKPSFKDRLLGR